MAETDRGKIPSLSEQYHLEKEGKLGIATKPAEEIKVENPVTAVPEEVVTPKTEETPAAPEITQDVPAAPVESSEASDPTAGESNEAGGTEPTADENETSESTEQENAADEEVEQTPEIKLETAPADFRFPTTNQSRHCFTRYIEYHRCIAAKGEGAPECDKFAKYYRSLCPGEWIDRWNEQRENGIFPGPL